MLLEYQLLNIALWETKMSDRRCLVMTFEI